MDKTRDTDGQVVPIELLAVFAVLLAGIAYLGRVVSDAFIVQAIDAWMVGSFAACLGFSVLLIAVSPRAAGEWEYLLAYPALALAIFVMAIVETFATFPSTEALDLKWQMMLRALVLLCLALGPLVPVTALAAHALPDLKKLVSRGH